MATKLPLVNGQVDVLQGLESIRITLFYFFEFYHDTLPIPNEGGKPRPPSLICGSCLIEFNPRCSETGSSPERPAQSRSPSDFAH